MQKNKRDQWVKDLNKRKDDAKKMALALLQRRQNEEKKRVADARAKAEKMAARRKSMMRT